MLVVLVVKVPELATPPLTSPHYPSTPSPHPLPKPGQWEVRVTVATLIFPLWVHLPAEKGSRWCNMKPWSTPPGTLVFPVPSIFSMKFLCLSLTESGEGRERDKEGGREGRKEGGREGCSYSRKNIFFSSFSLQSVRGLKGGVLEAKRELSRSADTVKKFVCLLDILF